MTDNVELMKGIEFPTLPTEDVLEFEKVDYNTLDKKELIDIIETKDKSIENYKSVLETKEEQHKKYEEDINDYYRDRLGELNSLIRYYERKIKLIRDLIELETGGEA